MELLTRVPVQGSENPITYNSRILTLGSCFAVHIGNKLHYYQFRTSLNPFGIIYQPQAIYELVRRAVAGEVFKADELFQHEERWHCFAAHSELSHPDRDLLLKRLNTALEHTKKSIGNSTHLLITLGTSWVYRHKGSGKLVANCHKVPQREFRKELLTVPVIAGYLEQLVQLVKKVNPDMNVVFTVSPVRHLRDGFIENQRSKSHLISAIHMQKGAEYFPSYELMMDELRDYRFYEPDMIHPNNIAIDYIWDRFRESCISEEAYETMEQVEGVRKGLAHRPFNANSERHKSFLKTLQQRIAYLKKAYPYMDFS